MHDVPDSLSRALEALHGSLQAIEQEWQVVLDPVDPLQRPSAVNLLQYLALRCEDIRDLQDDLHIAGLSSLASSESHILRQIQAILARVGRPVSDGNFPCDYLKASRLLQQRANALFGPKVNQHIPHLMVTFESSLATNHAQVKALVKAGMNVARINCAHDNPKMWKGMIDNVRKASRATGHSCKIYMDLAGPKIRTVILGKGRKKGSLKLQQGEQFWLCEPKADFDKNEKVVGCTLKGIVPELHMGDRVLFDDGLFEAIVEQTDGQKAALLNLVRVSAAKPRLKTEKGINFPDTNLSVHSLTAFDKSIIPFVQENADLVGFSFIRHPEDVAELQDLLQNGRQRRLPLILKIETYEAVQNLPALLLQGMRDPVFGVMIARGDLAVEIGFERLSEIQEEILWLCEAAHVPVVWATQVLESLNKSGIATRSEMTDAALSGHAECVMLNKGKHLLAVLASLRDILHRSGGHHIKKRYVFRPLAIAERFIKNGSERALASVSSNGSHHHSPRKNGIR